MVYKGSIEPQKWTQKVDTKGGHKVDTKMDLIDVKEEVAEMLRDCGGGRGVASAGGAGFVQMRGYPNAGLFKCGIFET